MKKQIKRFPPHQNAKVIAILMAIASLIFIVPMFILTFTFGPTADPQGNQISPSAFIFLLFPLIYLVSFYISVVIGCALYNFMFKYIGGFEFETRDENAPTHGGQPGMFAR